MSWSNLLKPNNSNNTFSAQGVSYSYLPACILFTNNKNEILGLLFSDKERDELQFVSEIFKYDLPKPC